MKDYIREIIKPRLSRLENENRIREYIQSYILYILYTKKIYQDLIFTGGTALRFIHKIKRFSEDLDFCLSEKARKYDFLSILKITKSEFALAGYNIEVKYNIENNVQNAFLKFPGLLYEFGISPLKDEKIAIKIEIDTNPPEGGREEMTIFKSVFMFYLHHYDLNSLFAGKLHALFCRKYTKGRDWYDLLWYLTSFKKLEPNLVMLNNALKQTKADIGEVTSENWKDVLREKIRNVNIEKVRNDVKRFLENESDVYLLTKENLLDIIERVGV